MSDKFSQFIRERQYLQNVSAAPTMAEPSSPSPEILYPEWQQEYVAALLELDPERLPQRVEAAETAIFKRLQAISQDSDSKTELQAIEDALAGLRMLKHEKLAFPDWEKK